MYTKRARTIGTGCRATSRRGAAIRCVMRFDRTCALAVGASVIVWPAVLFAHGVLRKSEPANGATLRAAPTVIRLTFSEAPQLAFTRVELFGPDSQRVALSELRVAAPDSAVVIEIGRASCRE